MLMRDRARWALATIISVAILSAPAVWNRFPLLQWDTGGYIARWYEHTLVINRSTVYGLFLNAGSSLAFWPVVAVQSLITVWVLALTLRAFGLGGRPWLLTGIIAALSVFTTLPWLTSILLTDIFAVTGVLGLYLLLLHPEVLGRGERIGLFLLVAFAAATHSATMAVLGGLIVVAAVYAYFDRRRLMRARLAQGTAALALGAAMLLAGNYYIAGALTWTPGGMELSFGHMLQYGIVDKYLDAHCPDPKLRLCQYRNELPHDADAFFWASPLFDKLGRFAGLHDEMRTIAFGSMVDYPLLQIETAAMTTAQQLVAVHTGQGTDDVLWHTWGIIRRYLPQLAPAMDAAHQQHPRNSFTHLLPTLNALHYPLALAAMAALPVIVLLALLEFLPFAYGELAAVCIIALFGNAFVCGALATPHDRYGARMVWMAVFVVAMALCHALVRLRQPRMEPAQSAEPLFN